MAQAARPPRGQPHVHAGCRNRPGGNGIRARHDHAVRRAWRDWPVVADEQIAALPKVSIGGGAHGVAFTLTGPDLIAALTALPNAVQTADVTDPL